MVGSVIFLLLCSILGGGSGEDTFALLKNENKLLSSAQIHYQYCDTRFNCIIPSKYFNRVEEKSLHVTLRTDIEFKDGLEIHVINSSLWYLTLMTTDPKSNIDFTWGNDKAKFPMMQCNETTKADELQFFTPHSTLKTAQKVQLTYLDNDVKETPGLVCKYKLERKPEAKDTTMALIFGDLVHRSAKDSMCFKVTGGAKDEEFCSSIGELKPTMRLTFNPLECTGCNVGPEVCQPIDKPETCTEQKQAELYKIPVTNCEYFIGKHYLLVNEKMYTTQGEQIFCHQKRWVMKRFKPQPDWDNPNEGSPLVYLPVINSLVNVNNESLNCAISSPLKSVCQGSDCTRITVFTPKINCPDGQPVIYYRQSKKNRNDVIDGHKERLRIELSAVNCNLATGIWHGYPFDTDMDGVNATDIVYTLRTGDSIVCESSDFEASASEYDDLEFESDAAAKDGEAKVRRDDAVDYTDAIIVCTAVVVASAILLILGVLAVASCLGSMRKPVGLPKSERSQAPISAAGEAEMSLSHRVSFLLT